MDTEGQCSPEPTPGDWSPCFGSLLLPCPPPSSLVVCFVLCCVVVHRCNIFLVPGRECPSMFSSFHLIIICRYSNYYDDFVFRTLTPGR